MTSYFLTFPTIVVQIIRTNAYDRFHQAAQVDAGIQRVSPRITGFRLDQNGESMRPAADIAESTDDDVGCSDITPRMSHTGRLQSSLLRSRREKNFAVLPLTMRMP